MMSVLMKIPCKVFKVEGVLIYFVRIDYLSLHCSAVSSCCIEDTVHSTVFPTYKNEF